MERHGILSAASHRVKIFVIVNAAMPVEQEKKCSLDTRLPVKQTPILLLAFGIRLLDE
jgi:hypothetical protein